jgi:hypothetical protein
MDGEVLKPSLEAREVPHADAKPSGVALLGPALGASQLSDAATDVFDQTLRVFARHDWEKARKRTPVT